jgi:hypothetical protein
VIVEGMLKALTVLYGAAGVVTVSSYASQIRVVWRSQTGAADVSLLMWSLWSATAAIAVLYAQFVSHDARYVLLSMGNAVGCFLVTGLTILKRSQARGGRRPA